MEHISILINLLEGFGPVVAVIVFFVVRDWRKQDKAAAQLAETEVFVRTELIRLIASSNNALRNNTDALRAIVVALGQRPCIAREMSMLNTRDLLDADTD